jgi:hypothetical protein
MVSALRTPKQNPPVLATFIFTAPPPAWVSATAVRMSLPSCLHFYMPDHLKQVKIFIDKHAQ